MKGRWEEGDAGGGDSASQAAAVSRELLASQADGSGAASLGADGHGASGSGRGAGTRRFSAWPDLGGGRFQGGASCGDGRAEGEKAGPGLLPRVPVPSTLASRGRVRGQAEPAGAGACAHVELPDGFTQAQEWGAGGLPKEGEADATEAGHRHVGRAAGRERSPAESAGPRGGCWVSSRVPAFEHMRGAGQVPGRGGAGVQGVGGSPPQRRLQRPAWTRTGRGLLRHTDYHTSGGRAGGTCRRHQGPGDAAPLGDLCGPAEGAPALCPGELPPPAAPAPESRASMSLPRLGTPSRSVMGSRPPQQTDERA